MKQARLLFLLFALLAFASASPAPRPAARANRDYALFFAVNDYRPGSGFEPLTKPIANTEAIARELRERYGFSTEVVKNPTLDQIGAKLREYQERFAKNPQGQYPSNGQLLIYFSGHGIAEDNNGYFVPSDGDRKKLYSTAFAYEIWRPFINRIDCRHILVAIDACYSVTFDPDWYSPSMDGLEFRRPGELSEGDKLLLANEKDKCRILFSSDGRADKVPERSNFARKFLEGLQSGARQDGVLTSTALAGYLEFAAPRPRLTTFGSDEKGSFVFVSLKPNAPAADPSATDQLARDLAAWRAAKAANTIAAYQQYLADQPRGEFREQASTAIRSIQADLERRRDDLAWDVAREKNTPEAYQKYLSDFPQGLHRDEAAARAQPPKPDKAVPDYMVLVRGGSFEMGDQFGDGSSDEKPVRTVSLRDFYLGRTEVTFDEYDAFCAATNREKPSDQGWGRGKRPAINVSWHDAVAYCNWLSERQQLKKVYTVSGSTVTADWGANGYRLPTEAEWEYAARSGGRKERYAGFSEESSLYRYANFCDKNCEYNWKTASQDDKYSHTAPVGSYLPNGLGLLDMTGNVWEWCWDWYGSDYYGKSERDNPRGPSTGGNRVLRGGSWYNAPADVRAANRDYSAPSRRNGGIGFRLARAAGGG